MLIRSLITVLVVLAGLTASAQSKQFVCTPCGSDCDKEIYDHDGSCHSCGMALVEKSSAVVFNITVGELCNRIAANPKIVLLDVRSEGEFKGTSMRGSYGYFKNAININIDELEGRLGELSKYKNDEIVVYCSHSRRSPRGAYILSSNGFKNVKNMAGGVSTLAALEKDECLKSKFVFR